MDARTTGRALLLALALLVALPAGCGGPTFIVQQYDGPPRPAETIAVIRMNGKDPIVWDSLDGEDASARVPEDARLHIEVLPGEHTLRVRSLHDLSQVSERISFRAEAGKVYRPVFETSNQAHEAKFAATPLGAARIYEVDSGSDALVRDVTMPARRATDTYPSPPARPAKAREPSPSLAAEESAEPDQSSDTDAAPSSLGAGADASAPSTP